MPQSLIARYRSDGERTPSERSVWMCRSTRFGCGVAKPGAGSWNRLWMFIAALDVDDARDALDGRGRAGGRFQVELDGVENDRPAADLETRRQGVDEARQDGGRIEADDAVQRPGHADVADVGRAARQDPLVGGGHVGVRAADGADPPVEIEAEGV